MNDSVYFEGDPATDSARRRMERLLKGQQATPRWPWVLAALGGGGLWMMFRWGRAAAQDRGTAASPNNSDVTSA